tara:strand:+ start:98 stop:862 length:765 start_codon:yes stop_codon:yes gene_type:complete
MTGYSGSPSGYMNPVSVDKIQHPDYDAKAAENTTMRVVQYLYPVLKNCVEMLETLCKETEATVPTDLQDNMEWLKTVYNTQIDWHPRTMYGDEAAEELNARLTLHEEWATEDNAHHSVLNWQNPYGTDGTLQQAPAVTQPYMQGYGQQMNPYGQQMPQQGGASMFKPWTWFGGATQPIQPWQLPPPQIDQLHNGEQYYTANGGGPPPLAQQQGYMTLPVGAIGWNMAGQPIDYNGMVIATTGEKLLNTAISKIL